MKTRDLKNKIKESIYEMTPEVIDKIDFHKIDIEPKKEVDVKPKTTFFRFNYVASIAFVFSLILIIVTISLTPSKPKPIYESIPLSLNTKEEIYSISSLSSVFLLHQNKDILNTYVFEAQKTSTNNEKKYLINDNINILNQFLNFLEPLFTNKDNVIFLIENSSIKKYEKQITLSSILLNEDPVNFIFYYNEKTVNGVILIDGEMTFQSKEYTFNGNLKSNNGKEKFELKAYEKNNHLNYIEVEQIKQNNKQKFEYSLYKNDEEIFEQEIEIELKENGIIVELEYETNNKEVSFEIYKAHESNKIIIEYEIEGYNNSEEGEILITVVYNEQTNKNTYHYNIIIDDDNEIEFDKDRVLDGDYDDDDDDD